jgi:hypothetical protein
MRSFRRHAEWSIALVSIFLAPGCGGSPPENEPANGSFVEPTTLGQTFTGSLSASGTSWATHTITLAAPGTIDATLDWDKLSADFNLFLYDPSGNSVAHANSLSQKPEKLSFQAPAPGTYKLGIKCKTGSGKYTLSTSVTPAWVDHEFTGTLAASGTSWVTHVFDAAANESIAVTLNWPTASADLNVFLYDPAGATVAYANTTTARPETLQATANQSGTYKVGIKCKTGSTAYDLDVRVSSATAPPPPPPPPPPTPTYPGQAPAGKLVWGCAFSGNGDVVTRHEQPSGHALAVHRTFFQWDQRTGSMINMASDDLAHSRLPWVSTKTPSWAAMAAGTYDAQIDQMLNALNALPGPVWLTIHHEPEGGGGVNSPDDPAGPAGHVAMNKRVRQRMTALNVDNVALAPILMSYTWTSASGRNPNEWWEAGIYDFLGVDHYRDSQESLVNSTFLTIRQWAAQRGVDVAVGEWGMRGTDAAAGQRVRDWYNHAAGSNADGKGARVVGLSAFDSGLNSPSGSWELQGEQLTAFWELLNDPRTADVVP